MITAGSGVKDTYYGMPVIRAPNWHWLVVHYLYLGGMAGASAVIAVLADLFSDDRALVRAARYLSAAAILPCPALLALDLGRPDRALHMLRIVKLRSPLSMGSWALLVVSGFSSLAVGVQAAEDLLGRRLLDGVQRIVGIVTLPVSYFLSGYTGMLLAVTNVPLWARFSPLLSGAFMASSFSNTFAALSLILRLTGGERADTARKLARAESVSLATEATLLTAGLVRSGKLNQPLTRGKWAAFFWPFTYVGGVLVPLVLQLSGPATGKEVSGSRRVITSLLAMTGSYVLRMSMIFAGHESAKRPQDYFELTKLEPER